MMMICKWFNRTKYSCLMVYHRRIQIMIIGRTKEKKNIIFTDFNLRLWHSKPINLTISVGIQANVISQTKDLNGEIKTRNLFRPIRLVQDFNTDTHSFFMLMLIHNGNVHIFYKYVLFSFFSSSFRSHSFLIVENINWTYLWKPFDSHQNIVTAAICLSRFAQPIKMTLIPIKKITRWTVLHS